MATSNDVTGDAIQTRVASKKYRDNWDAIFNKEKKEYGKMKVYHIDEHGMATITIPKEEYDRLCEREEWLECLEAAGVDNWGGFDVAHDIKESQQ